MVVMHLTANVHRVTPTEAADYFFRCAQAIESIDNALDEAQALIQSVVDTIDWESFEPEQRVSIKQWHLAVIASRKTLRLPNV
jgi:hypothetical protein